jgi:signal transduction histidine kinase
VLAAARDNTDRPGRNASRTRVPHEITSQRAREDRVVRDERDDADDILSDERDERVERVEQTRRLAAERNETDQDLSIERERSDDAVAVRDDFLGIVSHDLRNMLSSIVLSARFIEESAGGERGERAEHLVISAQRIRRGGARMSRLVGDLLDVASIEAGALAVACESADAALVVAEVIETFQAQADANAITLNAEVVAPVMSTFDPARILQVLSNLLSNAIKFTPSGGTITVRAECTRTDLYMCVTDTGAGIPADKLDVVFQRSMQLNRGDRRGIGLGLYISDCIVHGHGGRIWAESEPGAGSKFCFTLPHPPTAAAEATASRDQ